jgi:hypothetical protein
MNDNWQTLTLGDLYRNGLAKVRQVKRNLNTYSPLKLDLQAATNLLGAVGTTLRKKVTQFLPGRDRPALPSHPEPPTHTSPRRKPWQSRTEQLELVLAEAWAAGSRTYSQLLEWVRLKTGKGCSHRAIARFRKSVQD